MSNRKKKRPPQRPSGYRDPKPAPAPARKRGLLDSMFAPRVPGSSSMPRIRTAITRGVVTVLGSPVLVVAPAAYLLGVWLLLVAAGYQGPFAPLANLLALPPIGTSLDATFATSLFGLRGGLYGIMVFLVVRAIVLALITAAIVQALEDGRVGRASLRRAIRAMPGLPGAQSTSATSRSLERRAASACSRAPLPSTSTLIGMACDTTGSLRVEVR